MPDAAKWLAAGGLALACAALAPPALAADPALQLAKRYAPVVRLVEQTEPCGHGEPFEPTDVNVVLGNADVALRGPWDTTNVVKVAPTAQNLESGLFEYNLDFPGNALTPACNYDQWANRVQPTVRATAYARIAVDASYPDQIALQYWFFYLFNDFNDKHEGDWEMIQLDFDAASAEAALAQKPAEIGYSQHEGAERAHWGDDKLEVVDGTHPVVYPALGSHANYYESQLYLGRSAAEGVGCDDTVGPSRELRPEVALVPTVRYLGRYPWLGYVGRWGERHSGFYNGPTGPNTKQQWTAPITWAQESWRDRSYTVPAGHSLGTGATDFFCGAVATGSSVLTALVGNATPVLLALAAILALMLWLASRTRWDLSMPFRVRRRRPWGSLVTSAFELYKARPLLFLEIGLLFLPLGILISGVQYLLFRLGEFAPLLDSVGASNAFVAAPAFALGLLFTVVGLAVVQTATAVAVDRLDKGEHVSGREAYAVALHNLTTLFRSLILAVLAVALLGFSLIGVIIGLWLAIRWSLLAQVVALEEDPSPGPLRRSAHLVRGYWWRVASLTLFVTIIALLLGPLIGTLLLFVTRASFDLVNLVSSLVYAVTLPFVAITTTYLYFDLRVREALEPQVEGTGEALPAEI